MNARVLEESWQRVCQLAERHPGEWEGQDLTGEAPLRVFAGSGTPHQVLVSTKEAAVRRWDKSDWPPGLVVVVAIGRLTRAQAAVIGGLAQERSTPIPFVGDADPVSLHTFLSLRVHLGARRVRFCGVCDDVLDAIGDERVQPEKLETLRFSALDRAHLRVLASIANLDGVLGPRVSAVLATGRKVEIESLSFRADLIEALFRAALTVAASKSREVSRKRRRKVAR